MNSALRGQLLSPFQSPLLPRPPVYPASLGSSVRAAGRGPLCSVLLLLSCFLAAALILGEVAQGLRRSLYCRAGPHSLEAPFVCVVPLTAAAVSCNAAVVGGLLCVARFAWRGSVLSSAGFGSISEWERHRTLLREDFRAWRGTSTKVLLVAGVTYVLVGAPCAGVATLAFVFLATSFLTLYASALFFDDDFEQVRLTPRYVRFLGVYTLVGLTFAAMSSGVMERLGGKVPAQGQGQEGDLELICTNEGQTRLSPASCTVPLDLATGLSLWWAACPLFAALLPAQSSDPGAAALRRFLQRWRRHIDLAVLGSVMILLTALYPQCNQSSPVAFHNATLGALTVLLMAALRRASPEACDGWRGPLEHLQTVKCQDCFLQCPVCLGGVSVGEEVCRTPCGHDFHRDCLEDWVLSRRARSADCPLCREPLATMQDPLGLGQLLN